MDLHCACKNVRSLQSRDNAKVIAKLQREGAGLLLSGLEALGSRK